MSSKIPSRLSSKSAALVASMYLATAATLAPSSYWSFSQSAMTNNRISNALTQANGVDIIGMDFVGEIDHGSSITSHS